MTDQVNIMIVEDSVIIQRMLEKILSKDNNNKIISTAENGKDALDRLSDTNFAEKLDIILLDIEMPEMDGISAIPSICKLCPESSIIMVSSLTYENAEQSLKALKIGAKDYIAKPTADSDKKDFDRFSEELLNKVRLYADITKKNKHSIPANSYTLIKSNNRKPHAIAFAASTGGPDAIEKILLRLDRSIIDNSSIFITQHMPVYFTKLLASMLSTKTGFKCVEGMDGQKVELGTIYIAPGGYHMTIKKLGETQKIIKLNQEPPINFCRPAADPMIESLSKVYSDRLLVCILTGMGIDGLEGSIEAQSKGANIIAQDANTSVVFGMPQAVLKKEICCKVSNIENMAEIISNFYDE